jgi:hypothetical protein
VLGTEFWPTAAQVMPVLALAIIVEARATINRWNDQTSGWLRFIQCILWVSPLAFFVYLEPTAFSVMAGQANPVSSVGEVNFSIALSLSSLISAPAFELLFRSNTKTLVSFYVVIRSFKVRLRMARNMRRCKQLLRDNMRAWDDIQGQLARLAKAELEIAMFPDGGGKEGHDLRQVAAALRENTEARRDELKDSRDRTIKIMDEITEGRASFKDVEKEFVSTISRELAKAENMIV